MNVKVSLAMLYERHPWSWVVTAQQKEHAETPHNFAKISKKTTKNTKY